MTVNVNGFNFGLVPGDYYGDVRSGWVSEHDLWGLAEYGPTFAGLGAEQTPAEVAAEEAFYRKDQEQQAALLTQSSLTPKVAPAAQITPAVPDETQPGHMVYRRKYPTWWEKHGNKVLIGGGVALALGAVSWMLVATFGVKRHRQPAYAGLGRMRRRRRRY